MSLEQILQQVRQELDIASHKFPTWPVDPLHAVAIVSEESGELVKSVMQHVYEPEKSTLEDIRTEAVQTAAMAIRFIASLEEYNFERSAELTQSL